MSSESTPKPAASRGRPSATLPLNSSKAIILQTQPLHFRHKKEQLLRSDGSLAQSGEGQKRAWGQNKIEPTDMTGCNYNRAPRHSNATPPQTYNTNNELALGQTHCCQNKNLSCDGSVVNHKTIKGSDLWPHSGGLSVCVPPGGLRRMVLPSR